MAGEIPIGLLKDIASVPEIAASIDAVSLEAIEGHTFKKAQQIIRYYGDSDEGEPKGTDTVFIDIGENTVRVQLLENPPTAGFLLRAGFPPKERGGEYHELDIVINEKDSQWAGEPIQPDQLRMALGLTIVMEKCPMTPPMDPWTKQRIKEEMQLPFREVLGLWEMRWREEDLYRQGWNGL